MRERIECLNSNIFARDILCISAENGAIGLSSSIDGRWSWQRNYSALSMNRDCGDIGSVCFILHGGMEKLPSALRWLFTFYAKRASWIRAARFIVSVWMKNKRESSIEFAG
jgi:hypothetical protein